MDNPRFLYLISISVFGGIGGYIPSLLGADGFSVWGIIGSFVGGAVGIWLVYKYALGN